MVCVLWLDFLVQLILIVVRLFSELFVNTKMDEGPCSKLHLPHLKEAFDRHGDPYMYDSIIERDFSARLNEADRLIRVRLTVRVSLLF